MRKSRYSEEKDHPGTPGGGVREDGEGCVPRARNRFGDVLRVEGQVRRDGRERSSAAQGARAREPKAESSGGRPDASRAGPQGRPIKKMVTSAARRGAVSFFRDRHGLSERQACRLARFSRSSYRRKSLRAEVDQPLRERLLELAAERPRFGVPATARDADP